MNLEKPYDQELLRSRIRELLHPSSEGEVGVRLAGSHYSIGADRQKILNFFSSAYQAAMHAREGLRRANEFLEQRVAERTIELQRQTEEVQKSYAELEQVNYLVSHHLQNPLLRMLGFFGMIERQCKGKISSSTDRAFGEVSEGMQKLQTLINDLLLYSEKDDEELPVVEADLSELAHEVLSTDLAKDVQLLDADITVGALPRARVNPWQIKQVFFNRYQNAMKFHGAKRPVIRTWAEESDTELRISIQDNGVGISPSYFESIFYISPRVHSSTSFLGTGVGLAICRKIVERHGGKICVESIEGVGSTFHFSISKSLGQMKSKPGQPRDLSSENRTHSH